MCIRDRSWSLQVTGASFRLPPWSDEALTKVWSAGISMIPSRYQWFSKYNKAKTWLQWPPTLQLSYLRYHVTLYFMITNRIHFFTQTWKYDGNVIIGNCTPLTLQKERFLFNTERCWYTLITEFKNSTVGTFKHESLLIIIIKMNCTED